MSLGAAYSVHAHHAIQFALAARPWHVVPADHPHAIEPSEQALLLYLDPESLPGRRLGTWLPRAGQAPADVGLDDEPSLPMDYLGQVSWPLR